MPRESGAGIVGEERLRIYLVSGGQENGLQIKRTQKHADIDLVL